MTTLTINDLATDKELDREAMRAHLGGRGLGRSALFNFFLPGSSSSGFGASAPILFNQTVNNTNIFNTDVTNTLNQVFVDTLQFNQLNQIVDISGSDNASVDLIGNQQNGNIKALGFAAAA